MMSYIIAINEKCPRCGKEMSFEKNGVITILYPKKLSITNIPIRHCNNCCIDCITRAQHNSIKYVLRHDKTLIDSNEIKISRLMISPYFPAKKWQMGVIALELYGNKGTRRKTCGKCLHYVPGQGCMEYMRRVDPNAPADCPRFVKNRSPRVVHGGSCTSK